MARSDLPPLGALAAFEAAVRHASVSRAAAELHLTHGAVSRQIQHLERALGVQLFERRHRAVVPTPAAVAFAQEVNGALDLLTAAARRVRASRELAPLVLSCEPTLLMRWLIPRLPAMPTLPGETSGLDLRLVASGGPVAFERDGIDVAIRRNDFPIPAQVRTHHLFDERTRPVCTPQLARALTDPADLARLPRLHTRTRMSAWQDWERARGASQDSDTSGSVSGQTFEHFYLSLQAAVSGLGVAIGPLALVGDDVAADRLAAPFGFAPDGGSYVLMSALPDDDPRVVALLGWLRDQARSLSPS